MSKLDELITKLCPDGVEYKKLGSFATVSRGGNFQKKDFTEIGVPCVHYGQIYTRYKLFADTTFTFISEETAQKQKFAQQNDIIMAVTSENIEDVCKCIGWLGESDVAVSGHAAIIHHNQDPKYLTYWFHTNMFFAQKRKIAHGTKVIEVSPDKLLDMVIPVPPLPVQGEIVRIIDNFTEFTTELTTKLTAELAARQKQYDFYRNHLLACDEHVQIVELRCVVKKYNSGATPTKGNSTFYENGTIPWIRTQDVRFNEICNVDSFITEEAVKKTAAKWIPENCVIVAISGASAGRCAINKIRATTNQHCLNMQIDESKALYKYVYFCVCNCYDELLSRKQGARGDLNSSLILGITIPLPSLEEQKRIVTLLENFESIVTSVKKGLLAEITARQKQYEYYRDKLLTFKPLEN